jgi:hypothetical protein
MGVGALFRILRDEYQGWKQFRSLTGFWPKWSILCSAFAAPILFLCATILILMAFEKYPTGFLHWVVFLLIVPLALVWLAIRRIACAADAAMPLSSAPFSAPRSHLEEILR